MMCWKSPSVSIYGRPDCGQCDMTKMVLDRAEVGFEYIDIEEDEDAYEYVTKTLGYRQAPTVVARYPDGSESHWSGFRPDKIKGYAQSAKAWSRDDS